MTAPPSPISPAHEEALAGLRSFLEQCWHWSHHVYYDSGFHRKEPKPTIPSTFMCRHTSSVLLELLLPLDPTWRLNGGTMTTADGRDPQPHWWVENDHAIVDLTADQFGWPTTVTVVSAQDERYVRLPGATQRRWINGLKTTLDQWKGHASRPWMEQDPAFQAIAQHHRQAHQAFQDRWQDATQTQKPASTSKPRAPGR